MNPILEAIDKVIVWYNSYIGEYVVLFLLIPTGLFFFFRLRFLNIRKLGHSFRVVAGKYDRKEDTGDIIHFRALTTALSATIGTGNIVGVSLAIYLGGPGSIFWMWITGFLGMMLKYTECTLSIKHRGFNSDGTVAGGPMYYMEQGIGKRFGKLGKILAVIFAFATILCSFGTGNMAQSNSMSDALYTNYQIPTWITGIVVTSIILLIIVGGIKRISVVTSRLVPFMSLIYIICVITILVVLHDRVPGALLTIFTDAWTGTAATGGFVGSTFIMTMIWGVRRGLFSNEAGQGSAAIAHAAAKTEYPAREGIVAMMGPFIDTIVICTLTALTIIVSGAWTSDIKGVGMTILGFETGLSHLGIGWLGKHIVGLTLLLFAFTTIVGWSYYGLNATIYLFGEKFKLPYQLLYGAFVFFGSIWGIDLVWHFVDMVITFMTFPNLIALLILTPVVVRETKKYFSDMDKLKKIS